MLKMYYKGEEIEVPYSGPNNIRILQEGNAQTRFKFEAIIKRTQEYVCLALDEIVVEGELPYQENYFGA